MIFYKNHPLGPFFLVPRQIQIDTRNLGVSECRGLEAEELRDLRDLRDVPKAELRRRRLKLRRMIVRTDELAKLCDLELAGVAQVAFAELGCKACEF